MMSTYNLTMANPAMATGGGGMAGLAPPGSATDSDLLALGSHVHGELLDGNSVCMIQQ